MSFYKFIFIFIITTSLFSKEILTPTSILEAKGAVTDLVAYKHKLLASTDLSSIDIFDLQSKSLINRIELPKILDFMGDEIDAKVYSVDILEDSILILSQGEKGGRNIFLYKDKQLTKIISDEKRMFIAKAKFLSKDKIIFSLLSNQLYLYDLKTKKELFIKQISQSKFSDFALNDDKSKIVIADESGVLHEYYTKDATFIKDYKEQNLDNVYQVDWKKNIILTAGQDRRAVVYNSQNSSDAYYKQVNFLIYSCGLTPSSQLAAFASDEQNNITVFNTQTQKELYLLTKNSKTITKILFLNEKELFVASDDKKINFYKLKD
ncbi:hypothetical protein CRU99_07555 [Malaciobacter mytili]|uniref:WD40 repeat domain-containing protein n=1 Tax=Malaciobacter mytili TaxID=603050 RepID=UPI00100B8EBD|nr:WD40 repeat domain-containing protein [Malaciobacter mytili]RXI43452.1 hypothetical protein CRU99_07555 [Malaciobacter mytili]